MSTGDEGTGAIATTTGVLVFLVLLLLAVQVVFSLYATSMVTAAAYDGARLAAGADLAGEPERAAAVAEAHVRALLGEYGRGRARVDVARDGGAVVVRVEATNPSFLPVFLRRPLGLDRVDRSVRVRVERESGA